MAYDTGPPLPAEVGRSGSRGSTARVMAVIGGVVLVGMVLVFGTCAVGAWWLVFSSGRQFPSHVVVSPDTTGFLRIQADADDAGVKGLIDVLSRAMDAAGRRERADSLPENLRFLAQLDPSESQTILRLLWPRDATLSLRAPASGEPTWAAAVNLSGFGGLPRLVSFFLRHADESPDAPETSEHRGFVVIDGDQASVVFAGSTIVVDSDRGRLLETLDRVVAEDEALTAAAGLRELAAEFAAEGDAHAVLDDRAGLLASNLGLPAAASFAVSLDLESADHATGRARAEAATGAEPSRLREQVRGLWTVWADLAAQRDLALRFDERIRDGGVDVEFELDGIEATLLRAVERAVEESESGPFGGESRSGA